jgi:hypothetical protein
LQKYNDELIIKLLDFNSKSNQSVSQMTTINNSNLVCQLNKDEFILNETTCNKQQQQQQMSSTNLNELINTNINDNDTNNKTVILQEQNVDSNLIIITTNNKNENLLENPIILKSDSVSNDNKNTDTSNEELTQLVNDNVTAITEQTTDKTIETIQQQPPPPPPSQPAVPKRLHVSNIPFRFRDPDLRAMFGVS